MCTVQSPDDGDGDGDDDGDGDGDDDDDVHTSTLEAIRCTLRSHFSFAPDNEAIKKITTLWKQYFKDYTFAITECH